MPSNTIKKLVADINNTDSDGGGLWLPNIQRLFVWEEAQIEKLFDSILRQYPLSSMLLWKTKDPIRRRSFITQYYENYDLKSLYQPDSRKTKRLVLDGQQRLQSLYLGLKGSLGGKTLHFNLLSGEVDTQVDDKADGIKYEFSFKDANKAEWPWIEFRSLIYTKKLPEEIVESLVSKHKLDMELTARNRVTRNISLAKREIDVTEGIIYQEIDGTDENDNYTFDDVVEIFIRANSGGTKLNKSDLMFALLTSHWVGADIEMDSFLDEINDNDRFNFSRDFVLKVAMSLLDKGAKYDVDKLRDEKTRKLIEGKWEGITEAIKFVKDQLVQKTFIRSDKALSSYNALIPLIYFYYHFPKEWKSIRSTKEYLLKTLLAKAFSGSPDSLIDQLIPLTHDDY